MLTLQYSRDKLESTISLLSELRSTDFPYNGPDDAIRSLEAVIVDRLNDISSIDPKTSNEKYIRSTIKRATEDVATALEFAGYIVNSSNVRNIFEIHLPLLRIAREIIRIRNRKPIQLILSFEWNYVPFTYPLNVPELPNFVIIGLPASESFNSLIIPAAGHELGHSVWRVKNYDNKIYRKVTKRIERLLTTVFWDRYQELNPHITKAEIIEKPGQLTWKLAYDWSMRQIQEIFCDIIGLGLFGEAYLHTFKYLIAPRLSSTRSELYPPSLKRAQYLVDAAKALNISVPQDFLASFQDEDPIEDPKQYKLLLDVSDKCTHDLFNDTMNYASRLLTSSNYKIPLPNRWRNITTRFHDFVPADNVNNLADIINAGWHLYHDKSFLPETGPLRVTGQVSANRRLIMINELVLKSIEMLEIHIRTTEAKSKKDKTDGT